MPPRKATKHSEAEVVDRAAEAGDVSPPKKKRTVPKGTYKNDEEKQIRLPRAAKLPKNGQNTQVSNATSIVTKNAKTKNTIPPLPKNASTPIKTNTKVKSTAAKRTKKTVEESNVISINAEAVINVEETETETKRTRTKAVTKKAGTDVDEEPKVKVGRRTKKGTVTESATDLEAPAAKKKMLVNAKVDGKESKPKTKITKEKDNSDVDGKSKLSVNKSKSAVNSETKDDTNQIEEINTTVKTTKKVKDKVIQTFARTTRADLAQPTKKRQNLKKKEETAPLKKVSKTRGKGGNHNVVSNEDTSTALNEQGDDDDDDDGNGNGNGGDGDGDGNGDDDTVKRARKNTQKKTNKENVSIATTKKGRGKRGVATGIGKNENGGKVLENSATGQNSLNSTEILASNNNVQKSSEDGNNKKQDTKEEITTHTNSLESTKYMDETVIVKDGETKNHLIATIREEGN